MVMVHLACNRNGYYQYRRDIPRDCRVALGRSIIKLALGRDNGSAVAAACRLDDVVSGAVAQVRGARDLAKKSSNNMDMTLTGAQAVSDQLSALAAAIAADATRAQRRQFAEQMQQEADKLAANLPNLPRVKQKSVADSVQGWLEYQRGNGCSPTSLNRWRVASAWIVWAWGKRQTASISFADIDALRVCLLSDAMPTMHTCTANKLTLRTATQYKPAKPSETLAPAGKQHIWATCRQWLKYAQAVGDIDRTITPLPLRLHGAGQQIGGVQQNSRVAFTQDELQAIYQVLRPQQHKGDTGAWHYWVFLICLYQGARPAEICQLRAADVLQSGDADPNSPRRPDGSPTLTVGCPSIAIRWDAASGQRTKNTASIRTIPIHPWLIAHGLLDYAAGRRGQQLFTLRNVEGKGWAHYATRYYGELLKKLKRAGSVRNTPAVCMYSTRHSYETALAQLDNKPEYSASRGRRLTGRQVSDDSVQAGYIDCYRPEALLPLLSLIDFGLPADD